MAAISSPPSPAAAPESVTTFSENTVTVLDWDDTLIPSSWLKDQGLTSASLIDGWGITKDMVDACDEIAPYVKDVVQKAQEYGKVFIVTNGTRGWVEKACQIFMPSISKFILGLPIISAADLYGHFSRDPISWKRMAFRRDVLDKAFGRMPMGRGMFISIGDGYAEQEAARNLMAFGSFSHVGDLSVRSLKIVADSSPAILIRQLQEVCQILPRLASGTGNLDLQWNTLPPHGEEEPLDEEFALAVAEPLAEPLAEDLALLVEEPLAEEKKEEDPCRATVEFTGRTLWNESYIRALFPAIHYSQALHLSELPRLKCKVVRSTTPAVGARHDP